MELARLAKLGFSIAKGIAVALRAYQEFHGLEVTGELDTATIRSMSAPRFCGCPDVMAISSEMEANRWPDPHIYWGFANEWRTSIGTEKAKEAITWATQQWEAVCGVRFTYCDAAFPAEARSRCLISCSPIDGAMGVLAQSELANGRDGRKTQQYDSTERWVVSDRPANAQIDLARVACHELGHFIGIPHIAAGNLLQPTYDVRIRGPQGGDVAEARARYGPPAVKPPPDDSPGPVERYLIEGTGIKVSRV